MRVVWICVCCFFFFKQKTAYEMRISDWSSDVCSSDLPGERRMAEHGGRHAGIVDRARIVPEQRIGKGMPLPDRHRRQLHPVGDVAHRIDALATGAAIDRKSVAVGKSVSVRVDFGGSRIIKTKTKIKID